MTLVLIIGEIGSGKTLFMVLMALSTDKNILANFHIKHDNFKYLEFDDFLNIPNDADIFIDEAYKWLENRRSSKASNVVISEIKEQRRKTNSTWYVSTQHPNMIDKRFEQYPNVIVQCKSRFPINSKKDFVYKISYDSPFFHTIYRRLYYRDAVKYFDYFDTNEIVAPENKQKIEYDILSKNPEKFFDKVVELSEIIEEDLDIFDYTHTSLKAGCLKHHIHMQYEPYIHSFLNNKIKLKKSKNKEKSKNSGRYLLY